MWFISTTVHWLYKFYFKTINHHLLGVYLCSLLISESLPWYFKPEELRFINFRVILDKGFSISHNEKLAVQPVTARVSNMQKHSIHFIALKVLSSTWLSPHLSDP